MAAVADTIKAPEWWHSTRIIQAFDAVLEDKVNYFTSNASGRYADLLIVQETFPFQASLLIRYHSSSAPIDCCGTTYPTLNS